MLPTVPTQGTSIGAIRAAVRLDVLEYMLCTDMLLELAAGPGAVVTVRTLVGGVRVDHLVVAEIVAVLEALATYFTGVLVWVGVNMANVGLHPAG